MRTRLLGIHVWPTGIGAIGNSATHGGSVDTRQPRLIAHDRIRFFGIAFRSQPVLTEKPSDPLRQQLGQSRDFRIVGRR